MSPEYRMQMDLTERDASNAVRLLVRNYLFPGGWRWGRKLYSLLTGAGLAVLSFVIAVILLNAIGRDIETDASLMYLLGLGMGGAMAVLGYLLNRRQVRTRLEVRAHKGQTVTLTPQGVTLENGRSHAHLAWQDFDYLGHRKGTAVLVHGDAVLTLPAHLLDTAATPGAVRAAIQSWFEDSR